MRKTVAAVIAKLVDTERNYILRKDEFTPELKKSEIERATTTEMLREISAIVRGGIPGGGKTDSKETAA